MHLRTVQLISILSILIFSGCGTKQYLSNKPDAAGIENQINVRFDDDTRERHFTGPNVYKIYYNASMPSLRLKAVLDKEGNPDIQIMLTVAGSGSFGFKKFESAITMGGKQLELIEANQNTNVKSGPVHVNEATSFSGDTVSLRETAKATIPFKYLRNQAAVGFQVTFKGEHGDETVRIPASYAQAFLAKMKSYLKPNLSKS
jgi:hypothetical protein